MGDSTTWCVLLESDGPIIINPSDNVGTRILVAVVLTIRVCLVLVDVPIAGHVSPSVALQTYFDYLLGAAISFLLLVRSLLAL